VTLNTAVNFIARLRMSNGGWQGRRPILFNFSLNRSGLLTGGLVAIQAVFTVFQGVGYRGGGQRGLTF
jgi:hypothetical protein